MDDDDEKEVSLKTWNKMVKSIHTEGYREGSAAGKDASFQDGFDYGYSQGFQNGYKLGVHNGVLSFLNLNTSVDDDSKSRLSSIKQHEEPLKGLCVLCKKVKTKESEEERTMLEDLSSVQEYQDKVFNDAERQNSSDELRMIMKDVNLTEFYSQ